MKEKQKKENADECIFKGAELLPGWMDIKETRDWQSDKKETEGDWVGRQNRCTLSRRFGFRLSDCCWQNGFQVHEVRQ